MNRFPGFEKLNPIMAEVFLGYHKRNFDQDPSGRIAEDIVDGLGLQDDGIVGPPRFRRIARRARNIWMAVRFAP
jgi:hypothetical protein